jgi:DNA repair and recombination protein RAD54B
MDRFSYNLLKGVIVVSGPKSTLYDTDGKTIAAGKRDPHPYVEGRELVVGGKDVQLDRPITREEYLSGTCFGGNAPYSSAPVGGPSTSKSALSKQFLPLKINSTTPSRPTASGLDRKGIPLQPVDLLSTLNNSSSKKTAPTIKTEDSYWTANW